MKKLETTNTSLLDTATTGDQRVPYADRKCAVESAQFWFEASRKEQEKGDMRMALLCLHNAFNHTENALFATRGHLKKVSDALLMVRPLGGSELFVNFGGEFYADPQYCGEAIKKLHADLHEARCNAARAAKGSPVVAQPSNAEAVVS